MADKTKIEWVDATWQVSGGCNRVSAGCENCYAERLVGTRLRHIAGRENLTVIRGDGQPHWTGEIRLYPDNLSQPLRWKKPRRIFVNSLSDLFHEKVPFEFIDRVFAVMALCPQHTFQILTKRPERMREYLSSPLRSHPVAMKALGLTLAAIESNPRSMVGDECIIQGDPAHLKDWPLPNVWLGTSCENQEAANERIPELLQCPAAVRFIWMTARGMNFRDWR